MPDLKKRFYGPELMDDLTSGGEELYRTLDELEVINKLLGGHATTLNALKKAIKNMSKSPAISIVDVGCGGGDNTINIYKWAAKKGYNVKLIGIDANPTAIEYAQKRSVNFPGIEYYTMDVFSDEFFQLKSDVILFALFCHHFDDEALVRMFSRAFLQVKTGIVINDLHRHPFAYYSIKMLTKLFSGSPMIKNDAPVSVARSFSRSELQNIFKKAGIKNYAIRWKWAFRWEIVILK